MEVSVVYDTQVRSCLVAARLIHSIYRIDISGPPINTVISKSVTATVSMRIVPDQSVEDVCEKFRKYVHAIFAQMNSMTSLEVALVEPTPTR
jgi:di- and tripeptidase